jgi:hypothetical protein
MFMVRLAKQTPQFLSLWIESRVIVERCRDLLSCFDTIDRADTLDVKSGSAWRELLGDPRHVLRRRRYQQSHRDDAVWISLTRKFPLASMVTVRVMG